MAQQRARESRPRPGEILHFSPTTGEGEIYAPKEGRTLRFDLKSSPGLDTDVLRPGIPVTYTATTDENGDPLAVELRLEEGGSLEARLRSSRKKARQKTEQGSQPLERKEESPTTGTSAEREILEEGPEIPAEETALEEEVATPEGEAAAEETDPVEGKARAKGVGGNDRNDDASPGPTGDGGATQPE